jgi:hypothetical protein
MPGCNNVQAMRTAAQAGRKHLPRMLYYMYCKSSDVCTTRGLGSKVMHRGCFTCWKVIELQELVRTMKLITYSMCMRDRVRRLSKTRI